jgi:hypothetical protein
MMTFDIFKISFLKYQKRHDPHRCDGARRGCDEDYKDAPIISFIILRYKHVVASREMTA